MRTFEFVVAIVAIVFTYRALAMIFGHRRRTGENAEAQGRQEETEARLAGLEDRIRVLERIVTDTKSDLKRQFRDLE
jgi:transcription elongation GreA/GreB family factor